MARIRVMIVEDDKTIAGLLAELIEAFGHEVCAIESSESGAVAAAATSNSRKAPSANPSRSPTRKPSRSI